MSDARVRELLRRARQGDVDAGVLLLSERRRNGTLSRERVWIAAALGDEAARLVEGLPFDEARELGWLRWSASQGQEVAVRLLAAALELVWRETAPWCFDPRARRFVEAVRGVVDAWLAAPATERRAPPEELLEGCGSSLHVVRVAALATSGLRELPPGWRVQEAADGVQQAIHATSEAAVRRALRDAVVPWALGW